ncbi:hypothetical protein BJ878DRAFT_230982 [Calycina marina]|uniref:Multiple RNA-binding domain-containing protein 1 n=1 Tax=Calycina marina TaxID=1763456 RepID=A0A9P7YWP7_9HELO|nr:hypothetical protein BJ878DRAFT_230982 [Calycina marina]
MESSRIFIKGLPPTISEEEFKKHFSAKHEVTDAKLISQRRIGYIGYKTPENAANAVKYFNRSFIRMSKIGVEIARPISDSTLHVSRKAQREQVREDEKVNRQYRADAAAAAQLNAGQKRKRTEVDHADEKLKEFLEVMQPVTKSKAWAAKSMEDSEPPTKIQAIELPEAESDGEYESIPTKERAKSPPKQSAPIPSPPVPSPVGVPIQASDPAVETSGASVSDDEWLRSRTNRLLDLVDPHTVQGATPTAMASVATEEQTMKPSDTAHEEIPDIEPEEPEEETTDPTIEAIKSSGRLFVRNLSYTATEQDLREHFERCGALEEIHLPLDPAGISKGFVIVQYENPNDAAEAFHTLDGEPFQGRLLHIVPGAAKRENKLDEFAIAKLPLKKQRQIKKKAEASSSTFNWNSLFMNQDAVNSTVATRLGISKYELLDPTSSDAGVRQAIAETSVIQEAKSYFVKNGVDLRAFKKHERGDTAILVKNFPYGMTLEELRRMFEEFGSVLRVLMPPAGTVAIIEMAQPGHAKSAFASLAYRRIKNSILYLEKGPKDLFTGNGVASASSPVENKGGATADHKVSASDLLESDFAEGSTTTIFVRNLNFTTTSALLTDTFKPLEGFMSARVNTKTDPKKPGQVLSMGFGFIEFKTKAQAQAAFKTMDGYDLEDHKLVIKISHKGLDAAEEKKKEDRAKKMAGKRTKIIVKNLPFQATKKDVRALFGSYGQLRSVRVPQKFDHSTRGFAFADFVTAREAENALEALKDTHLLGRRLVLEFAAADAVDAEEEIERMQNKVGNQVNKVAIENLTGKGRKKFNIQGDDDEN